MFDTTMIGKKIKQARIDQNMTQMNLADAMGVSYQAVSNWERGNSMPDISKLADLCAALHITVDKLLGIEAPTVTKAMAQEELTMEELAEIAPVLPPQTVWKQMEAQRKETEQHLREDVENISAPDAKRKEKKSKKLDLSRIADMAPFLDEEYLAQLLEDADLSDLDGLEEIAPFLSRETMEKLLDRASVDDMDVLVEIAPFLSKAALDKHVLHCLEAGDEDGIEELAPFLSKETLDQIAELVIEGKCELELEELYPFFRKETLRKLAQHLMEERDLDTLEELIPFL